MDLRGLDIAAFFFTAMRLDAFFVADLFTADLGGAGTVALSIRL